MKVSEIPFNLEARLNPKKHVSGDLEQASLLLPPEPETNVYSFGVLMLEIISGKLSFSDEYGSIEQWVYKHSLLPLIKTRKMRKILLSVS